MDPTLGRDGRWRGLEQWLGRRLIAGNPDRASDFLLISCALGTPALVAAKSRELIALFGDTRRFILNAGCAIPVGAPEAAIRAVVHAARSW